MIGVIAVRACEAGCTAVGAEVSAPCVDSWLWRIGEPQAFGARDGARANYVLTPQNRVGGRSRAHRSLTLFTTLDSPMKLLQTPIEDPNVIIAAALTLLFRGVIPDSEATLLKESVVIDDLEIVAEWLADNVDDVLNGDVPDVVDETIKESSML